MKIGKNLINREPITGSPYLIAEIGVNYYDIAQKEGIELIEACKLMIDEALNSGVDAVKFQTYKAKTLASKNAKSYWDTSKEPTKNQFELFSKFDHLDYEDYKELYKYTREKGGQFLTTCFDHASVDILGDTLPAFKIASADITNFPLIDHILKFEKPMLISTGASSRSEIFKLLEFLTEQQFDFDKLALLHCVLEYPTIPKHANLKRISKFHQLIPKPVIIGYSDHVIVDTAMTVLTTAWLLGANILEKHFTLDKSLTGNDHYHAMDPNDVRSFKNQVNLITRLLEMDEASYLKIEEISRQSARRSMIAARDIQPNEVFNDSNVIFKRPGTGISPIYWNEIIKENARSRKFIKKDSIIGWKDLIF